ncbi:MAG: aminotransferase class I/II-fold pyridoxal phosphate-dependent enzyme, partial [Rhodoferax sp.]
SPLGGPHGVWPQELDVSPLQPLRATVVLDCAYAPLRLQGAPSLNADQRSRVWQIFSPNKALGLTGVRAAYAIAPMDAESAVVALNALAPSWVVGAHGVALLQAWVQPEVQAWLGESLQTLRRWKAQQIDMLTALGWTCLPSDANFFCAHPTDGPADDADLATWAATLVQLRHMGIKLRDTASFGLSGYARLGVLPPSAQEALRSALIHIKAQPPASAKIVAFTP